jgi:hypothetical protein
MCCSPAAAGTICAMLGTTVLGSLREVPQCCPPGSCGKLKPSVGNLFREETVSAPRISFSSRTN